jgi:hypothetical protein
VIAGDITLADARKLVTDAFGDWKGVAPAPLPAKSPIRAKTRIILVHVPSAETSSILMGNTTIRGGDSTYYAATVVDRVFGGSSNSRLVRSLRDERRWAESPASALSQTNGLGMYQVGAEVRATVTDSAVRELLAQMRKIRTDTIAPEELTARPGGADGKLPARHSVHESAGQRGPQGPAPGAAGQLDHQLSETGRITEPYQVQNRRTHGGAPGFLSDRSGGKREPGLQRIEYDCADCGDRP